jgi:hypothetical protein
VGKLGLVADSQSIDPERNTAWIFALYGGAMLSVQGVENAVSFLYLVVNTDPDRKSNASARRQAESAIDRLRRAFQTGTAPMKLNDAKVGIKPHLPRDLYDELDSFLAGPRAQLPHRFLIERIVSTPSGGRFVPGTALYLVETSGQATKLTAALQGLTMDRMATWPESERPSRELQEFALRVSNMAMRKGFPMDLYEEFDKGQAGPPAKPEARRSET